MGELVDRRMMDTVDEFCHSGGCVQTKRTGGEVSLHDTKNLHLGALAVYSTDEYQQRLEAAHASGEAAACMFDSPEQYRTLTEHELATYQAYIWSSLLHVDELADGESVIAYGDTRNLQFSDEIVA